GGICRSSRPVVRSLNVSRSLQGQGDPAAHTAWRPAIARRPHEAVPVAPLRPSAEAVTRSSVGNRDSDRAQAAPGHRAGKSEARAAPKLVPLPLGDTQVPPRSASRLSSPLEAQGYPRQIGGGVAHIGNPHRHCTANGYARLNAARGTSSPSLISGSVPFRT